MPLTTARLSHPKYCAMGPSQVWPSSVGPLLPLRFASPRARKSDHHLLLNLWICCWSNSSSLKVLFVGSTSALPTGPGAHTFFVACVLIWPAYRGLPLGSSGRRKKQKSSSPHMVSQYAYRIAP